MMRINELLDELHQLTRREKWQVIQNLMIDLAQEEEIRLFEAHEYEIWSPYDSVSAANTLLGMLADEQSEHD